MAETKKVIIEERTEKTLSEVKPKDLQFTMVYQIIAESGLFSTAAELNAWSMLYNISTNANGCYVKRSTLGTVALVSDDQIGIILKKFVKNGLLLKEERPGLTNVYRLLKVNHPCFDSFGIINQKVYVEVEIDENNNRKIIKQYTIKNKKKNTGNLQQNVAGSFNDKERAYEKTSHDLRGNIVRKEYKNIKDFTSVKNAKAKLNKQEILPDNENPCLTKARSNYVDNIKSDSCPEEILPYIKYWENNKYKSCSMKRNSKTFKQTSEILLSMIDGSFFTNKNQKPGYKLTLSDFTKSVNNYYESLKIENRDPRRPVQTYSLITFLWNWNARTIRCPFLKYLNFTVRKPDLSIIDKSPKLTKYIIDKYKRYIRSLSYTPLADELDKFKSASNRLYKYFIDHRDNLMLDKDFETQVNILFDSIIESLPEGIKVNPGHLCSSRTFLRALPDYLKKYEMLKNKREDDAMEYKIDTGAKDGLERKAKQDLLEAQDWY